MIRETWVILALAAGCAGVQKAPLAITALDKEPGSECQPLGEVKGQHYAYDPRAAEARNDAWRTAQQRGATHVLKTQAYREGGHTEVFFGTAYRCGPPDPAPAK